MAISKSKRRYSVSLTPSNVDRFQALCKKLGLPPATMSNSCDDVLRNLSETFEIALQKGSIDISDLFKVMGKQMELHLTEEKEKASDQKKTLTVPERKKGKQTTR